MGYDLEGPSMGTDPLGITVAKWQPFPADSVASLLPRRCWVTQLHELPGYLRISHFSKFP